MMSKKRRQEQQINPEISELSGPTTTSVKYSDNSRDDILALRQIADQLWEGIEELWAIITEFANSHLDIEKWSNFDVISGEVSDFRSKIRDIIDRGNSVELNSVIEYLHPKRGKLNPEAFVKWVKTYFLEAVLDDAKEGSDKFIKLQSRLQETIDENNKTVNALQQQLAKTNLAKDVCEANTQTFNNEMQQAESRIKSLQKQNQEIQAKYNAISEALEDEKKKYFDCTNSSITDELAKANAAKNIAQLQQQLEETRAYNTQLQTEIQIGVNRVAALEQQLREREGNLIVGQIKGTSV